MMHTAGPAEANTGGYELLLLLSLIYTRLFAPILFLHPALFAPALNRSSPESLFEFSDSLLLCFPFKAAHLFLGLFDSLANSQMVLSKRRHRFFKFRTAVFSNASVIGFP